MCRAWPRRSGAIKRKNPLRTFARAAYAADSRSEFEMMRLDRRSAIQAKKIILIRNSRENPGNKYFREAFAREVSLRASSGLELIATVLQIAGPRRGFLGAPNPRRRIVCAIRVKICRSGIRRYDEGV